jgi:hypothetical protein
MRHNSVFEKVMVQGHTNERHRNLKARIRVSLPPKPEVINRSRPPTPTTQTFERSETRRCGGTTAYQENVQAAAPGAERIGMR